MTEEIPIEFPVLVRPFENVNRSENSPVRLLYEIPPVAEREVREIFVPTTHERVFTVPERVERFPERLTIFPVAVAIFVS